MEKRNNEDDDAEEAAKVVQLIHRLLVRAHNGNKGREVTQLRHKRLLLLLIRSTNQYG